MEFYHSLLCVVLIAVAVCFSTLDAVPEHAEDGLILDGSRQNCKCENGKCVTNKQGRSKCVCKPGFVLQDEMTCKPCDCGPLGSCIFVLKEMEGEQYEYQKRCVCDVGRAEKDGVCVDCFCGDNSACDFNHGERRCFCVEGYSEKDGICTKCDCGFYGECEYDNDNKICDCDKGYTELNGTCEECDCGEHGTCSFGKGQKICKCQPGFEVNNGKCESCDCGPNSEQCVFDNEVKRCKCKDGYADKSGLCEECDCGFYGKCEYDNDNKICDCDKGYMELNGTCEECDCGEHGTCSFEKGQKICKCQPGFEVNNGKCESCDCGPDSEQCVFDRGVKQCKCKDGYADKSGFCEECNCGEYSDGCNFNGNEKVCNCLEGYLQEEDTCEPGCNTEQPCQNGGYCKEGRCFCLDGTRGEFCEVVDECFYLCPFKKGIKCSYDVASQKAHCTCVDNNLVYNPNLRRCSRTCEDDRSCRNYGKCTGASNMKFCECLEGTTGEFCEEIPVCEGVKCGRGAHCVLNPLTKEKGCACRNPILRYDNSIGRCRYKCHSDSDCLNGGSCGANKFCNCMIGTQGDRCDIVDDCHFGIVRCHAEGTTCGFDLHTLKATCKCKNPKEHYNQQLKRCRGFCKKKSDCSNGATCGYGGFCDCLPGTQGPWCEIVDDCHYGRFRCSGDSSCCSFDPSTLSPICICEE